MPPDADPETPLYKRTALWRLAKTLQRVMPNPLEQDSDFGGIWDIFEIFYDLTDPLVHSKFPDVAEYLGTNPPNMGQGINREAPRHY